MKVPNGSLSLVWQVQQASCSATACRQSNNEEDTTHESSLYDIKLFEGRVASLGIPSQSTLGNETPRFGLGGANAKQRERCKLQMP